MPESILPSSHKAWLCIYNQDADGLQGHLDKDRNIVHGKPEKSFHPDDKYTYMHFMRESFTSFVEIVSRNTGAPKNGVGGIALFPFLIVGVLPASFRILRTAIFDYTYEAVRQETIKPQYVSDKEKCWQSVSSDMTLLHYALVCYNAEAVKRLLSYGNIADNINLLRYFLKISNPNDKLTESTFERESFDNHAMVLQSRRFGDCYETANQIQFRHKIADIIENHNNSQITAASNETDEAQQRIAVLEKQLAELEAKRNTESASLSAENEALHNELSQTTKQLKKKISEKNAEIAKLKRENSNLRRELTRRPAARAAGNPASFQGERRRRAEPAAAAASAADSTASNTSPTARRYACHQLR